ncbi:VOC family protein [Bacillus sp. 31A1R]|uniref:VOC family protein n=1 Tax=Robertmurraya mangrovi TaxID=3098077 RepID=A0ABU5IVT0_9BACI|nr:VOC family protein [Bacillus sp. 31A1R]MDZ5471247.1 VOC family protein [Bacillus sp. 31A1R]
MVREWKPGINHMEFWVSSFEKSLPFYEGLFSLIGWKKLNDMAYSTGTIEIYFKEVNVNRQRTVGPRHICFQAVDRKTVDLVSSYLKENEIEIIRGPIQRDEYSEGYYTVDFYDLDGYVLEVAYTPNMVL